MRPKIRINFSDFWHPDTLPDKQNNLVYKLLAKRFDLEVCDNPDFLIFSCFGVDFIRHSGVRIFYTGENVRPNYSLCDWAFSFDYSENPRNFRLPYYFFVDWAPLLRPRDAESLMRAKTGFCSFVVSNEKSKPRLKFFDKLSRYKKVDSGGKARNNIGYRVPDKQAFLRSYKFNIAFENESHPGYTTEKIAEAFVANTVPIYWGNPLIERDFNTKAFVNCHDFRNLDQVVEYIVELDRNDELYRRTLNAPAFPNSVPTEFVNEHRILDRFEEIFSQPNIQPVAQTMRGRFENLLREPKRRRRIRRMKRVNRNQ
jgi:hypothetical protein